MSRIVNRTVAVAVSHLGSAAELAKRLGISRQALNQWETIPVRHCRALEALTGIPKHEMRPDIFEPPSRGDEWTAA